MRWGILGASNIAAKALIPAMQRAEDTEVVAVASSSGKGRAFVESLSCDIRKVYDSYEQLLTDEEIDAVYISVPNHLHKKWTIEAAKHGKHVLCEKPASLTERDTEEMITACEDNQVMFLEAFMYQFHPQHDRVKEIIASGEIGNITLMKTSFSFYLDPHSTNIRLDAMKGGGSLFDVGCYGLHSIFNMLGSYPQEIHSVANVDENSGVDLTSVVTLKLESGILAQVDCSIQQPPKNAYEIIGDKGKITVPAAYRPDKEDGGQGKIFVNLVDGQSRTESIVGDQYKQQVEVFSSAVKNDTSLANYHDLTIYTIRAIEQCMEKIKSSLKRALE